MQQQEAEYGVHVVVMQDVLQKAGAHGTIKRMIADSLMHKKAKVDTVEEIACGEDRCRMQESQEERVRKAHTHFLGYGIAATVGG